MVGTFSPTKKMFLQLPELGSEIIDCTVYTSCHRKQLVVMKGSIMHPKDLCSGARGKAVVFYLTVGLLLAMFVSWPTMKINWDLIT
ncbi:transmembrane protein, putative [Medicago truncatula]|uniref:Transmembrane protein, putative n=1 Tax=Medicago truncatula TaxID=3880 RepID=G7JAP7_MEDTR|nr:transmembrane protein, putative [Medicago truncatula]